MEKQKELWRLIHYSDVWGNKRDGWEVNNLYEFHPGFEIDDFSNKGIIKKLKEINFLSKHVRANMLNIMGIGPDVIEIEIRRDYKPLCRLERVYQ